MSSAARRRAALKRRLPAPALSALARARRSARDWLDDQTAGERALSLQLRRAYPGVVAPTAGGLTSHEARWASQNGEDGVLLHLFQTIGVGGGHTFVEIGAGDGHECNSANLALNFGWQGLLVDGDANHVAAAEQLYRRRLGPDGHRVQVRHAFVSAENVNEVVSEGLQTLAGADLPVEIDLLSIDVDGTDYWLWRSLDAVRPRVVVIEFNQGLGAERSVAIPYQPTFDRFDADPTGCFYGASLAALTDLAGEKGFLLAGCESTGTNAFFVRTDVANGAVPPVTPRQAFAAFGGDPSPPRLAGYVDV